MRNALLAVVLAGTAVTLAPGQKLEIRLPDSLAAAAKEKAEINLDAATLSAGMGLAGSNLPKDLASKMAGVKEVHIYNYEYEKPGQYSVKDLEPLRKQLGPGSGWSSVLSVKEKNETTDILIYKQGDKVAGFLLISAEEKELSIIHVVGEMSMAKLQELVKSTIAYDLGSVKTATKP